MSIDTPIVVYDDGETTHSKKKMDELAEQWNARRKSSPFKKGQKINLNDYLQNKI